MIRKIIISLLIFSTILLITLCVFLIYFMGKMQYQIEERDRLIENQWLMMDKQDKALDSLMGSINNYFDKQIAK